MRRIIRKSHNFKLHRSFLGSIIPVAFKRHKKFEGKVKNLNPTEDGEAGEEPHCTTNEANLVFQRHHHIPLNLVKYGGVKIDLNQLDWSIFNGRIW